MDISLKCGQGDWNQLKNQLYIMLLTDLTVMDLNQPPVQTIEHDILFSCVIRAYYILHDKNFLMFEAYKTGSLIS